MRTLLVAAGLLLAGPSLASVCELSAGALPTGPVPFSLQAGEQATPRRPCPRTEVFLGGEGQAIVRPAEFYGNLQGGVLLGGSWALTPDLELFGSLETVLYQQVISSLSADYLGTGHGSVGATYVVFESGPVALAATSRATLPFASGLYQNVFPVGLDAGLTGVLAPVDMFRLYGGLLGTGSFVVSAGDPLPRAGLLFHAGVELVLFEWVSLLAEVKSLMLYEAALDHVSGSAALRGRIWRGLGAELYATAPFAGRERTLAAGGARLSWRFD